MSPAPLSSEYLSKRDELKAQQVTIQREEELKQRQVLDWLRHQHQVEEQNRALQRQLQEKRESERYSKELDRAYAKQIDYRVAKTREIDQSRFLSAFELKQNHQSALLSQILDRDKSRKELHALGQAERGGAGKHGGRMVFVHSGAKMVLS